MSLITMLSEDVQTICAKLAERLDTLMGLVVRRRPCGLEAVCCWSLTPHSPKISCSVFRPGLLLRCEMSLKSHD